MKYTIILGLLEIFVLLDNIRAEECVPLPSSWVDNIVNCAEKFNSKQIQAIYAGDAQDQEGRCYAACLYTNVGYFQDGKFSTEYIEEFLRIHVPHSLTKDLAALTLEAANEANSVEGDDCDKAYKFFDINGEEPLWKLQEVIFCPSDKIDEFEERHWGSLEDE